MKQSKSMIKTKKWQSNLMLQLVIPASVASSLAKKKSAQTANSSTNLGCCLLAEKFGYLSALSRSFDKE